MGAQMCTDRTHVLVIKVLYELSGIFWICSHDVAEVPALRLQPPRLAAM